MTDVIGNFIVQLKNASMIRKSSVSVPYSAFKMAIAEKLKEAGFISAVEKKGRKVKKMLEITLAYNENKPAIRGFRRISKPGRRVYRGVRDIFPSRHGRGTLLLSTPRGVLTDKEARKQGVGGEPLFEIW